MVGAQYVDDSSNIQYIHYGHTTLILQKYLYYNIKCKVAAEHG